VAVWGFRPALALLLCCVPGVQSTDCDW
jgi:hypothetical protein